MSSSSDPNPPGPFLPLHTALVLLIGVLFGLFAGSLTFLADNPLPVCTLTGLGVCGTSIPILRSLIGRSE
ncbi:hypothetical protein [Streptomyces asoensis]|uniref:hypothetical protein n=1 Tax=Streptomyces asoensis TaxID=249586 RepID=UPI0033E4F075